MSHQRKSHTHESKEYDPVSPIDKTEKSSLIVHQHRGSGGSASLNTSGNVLLLSRLQKLQAMTDANFAIALLCLINCGINITMLYFNYCINEAKISGTEQPISDNVFHGIEFWATFVFAVVEAFALMNSPKTLASIYENPLMLKLILFFNIVATFVPALLVTINLEEFEVLSHELEYANEITMSFVDFVFLYSLTRRQTISLKDEQEILSSSGNSMSGQQDDNTTILISLGACVVALVQLGLYNGFGRTADGDMKGETAAHYCEFVFEMVSSMITFWFTLDNKFMTEREIGRILYGNHDDCESCANQKELEKNYEKMMLNYQV